MKYSLIILWSLCVSLVFNSCDRNERIPLTPVEETGDPVAISLKAPVMGDFTDDTDPDFTIKTLHILAFHSGTKNIKYHSGKIDLTTVSQPITLQMWTGSYDFVFIANEHSSGAFNLNLLLSMYDHSNVPANYRKNYPNLEEEHFPGIAFSPDTELPAVSIYKDVQILGDRHLQYLDPFTNTVGTVDENSGLLWEVFVERLAVRVDMTLKVESSLVNQLNQVKFTNLPDKVYLFEKKLTDNSTIYYYQDNSNESRIVNISDCTVTGPDADNMYTYEIERVILPASVFYPASDKSKAVTIEIPLSSSTMKAVIGQNMSGNDFTSPRNNYYKVTGTLENSNLLLDVSAYNWIQENISGNTGEKKLNVDCLTATMSPGDELRIHFWSNQPSVYIDDIGYFDADCNDEYYVDDFFDNLSGENAANLSYEPVTGTGYIDIKLKSGINISNIPNRELRFYVNASGLRREIIITIDN